MLASPLNAILYIIYCFDFYSSKKGHKTGAQSLIQTLKGHVCPRIVIYQILES